MPPARSRAAALALGVLVLALTGCAGILNNNPDLRWYVFSHYGAGKVCPEMLKTSVSIHLEDRAPAVGRFFSTSCNVAIDQQNHRIVVSLAGTGYGYLLPAKRIGFSVTAAVEYRPDFVIAGDDTYLHAKVTRIVDGPHFQTGYIENPVIDLVGNVPHFGGMANTLGNQAVERTLTQGFTVIHGDRGDDFSLGILYPPQKPAHPFMVTSAGRFTFANETTDVQPAQLDFLGPFEVAKNGQAIFLSTTVQGPQVNLAVVTKATGDAWRDNYQTGKPMGPPPGPVLYSGPVMPGPVDTRRYNLPPGLYYVVVDNAVAGAPPAGPFPGLLNPLNPLGLAGGGGLARVSYVAQLAD